jgi:plastocyanin
MRNMKKVFKLGILVVLVAALLVSGCVDNSKKTEEVQVNVEEGHDEVVVVKEGTPSLTVNLKNFEFSPSELRVDKGDVVEFKDEEGTHTVTIIEGEHGEMVDETLSKGDSLLVKFNEDGEYKLVCKFHENSGMIGTIVVE